MTDAISLGSHYQHHWSNHPRGAEGVAEGVRIVERSLGCFAWWLEWRDIVWLAARPEVGLVMTHLLSLAGTETERPLTRRWLALRLDMNPDFAATLLNQLAVRSPARARSLLRRLLNQVTNRRDYYGRNDAIAFLADWPPLGDCPVCGEALIHRAPEEGSGWVECWACEYWESLSPASRRAVPI